MASTYSPNLRLELIGTGEQQGTWGTTTNTNLGTLIEDAICGNISVTVSDVGDTTLTTNDGAADQSRNMVLNLTGTITGNRNVITPAIEKIYVVKNATSGGYSVTLKVSGQTGVSIPNGLTYFVYVDGTDVRMITGSLANQLANSVSITGGTITGITDLAVADGGTGVSTITGIIKGNGTSAFTAAVAGTDYLSPASVGTIASQNSNNVSITGGTITGITDLAVADGGTGVSTITGIIKGNGTSAFTAAVAGTDYLSPSSIGTIASQNSNNVSITGGAISNTTINGGTFTGNSSGTNTGDQNIFQTFAVAGQSNVVADSTTDTITFAAGSGIQITTNATSDTITIAATGGSGTVTSVNVSGGTTGLTTSGGPITTSGTITLAGTLALANGGTGATTNTGARTNLGLGTAAIYNTGTSGNAVALLNGQNDWSENQTFSGNAVNLENSNPAGNSAFTVKGNNTGLISTDEPLNKINLLDTDTTTASGQPMGVIRYGTSDSGAGTLYPVMIMARANGTSGGGYLEFYTAAAADASPVLAMTISATGVITSLPTYQTSLSGSPRDVYVDSTGKIGYFSSTLESKTNISNLSDVSWLYSLRPVEFKYRIKDENGNYTEDAYDDVYYGLIAEEVEAVNSSLVFYDNTESGPEIRGVSYEKIMAPMLKELQNQKTLIDSLIERVAYLESRM